MRSQPIVRGNSHNLLYLLIVHCVVTTLQDVRLELGKEDAEAIVAGVTPPHLISATAFLMKGLELEELQ